MNKLVSWLVSKLMPVKLDGVPVRMVSGLGAHVEVVFASDTFTFWGGNMSMLIEHDEQFIHNCRVAIQSAAWQLNEPEPVYINMSWDLYQKLRRAVKAEKLSGVLSEG